MILTVVASGSKGNAFVLDNGKHKLLIECGVSFMEIKKAIDFEIDTVVGCICSHSHKDHSLCAKDLVKAGINLYSSHETLVECFVSTSPFAFALLPLNTIKVGSFQVMPFEVEHDAPNPYGYVIIDEITGERILFATDTHMLRYRFKNIDHYLIECNYDDDTIIHRLSEGHLDEFLYKRIVESHMSLKTLTEALKSHKSTPKTITLMHLSDSNCNEKIIVETIAKEFGIIPFIADAGVTIGM